MKREGQIRQQLKQVIYRHRKRYVTEGLKQKPVNCKHNDVVRLPVHTANRATIRVCRFQNGQGWNNRVCDSSMGGDEQAQECPYFDCKNTPKGLKEEFSSQLGLDGTPVVKGILARDYPDIAALLWVLGPGQSMRAQQEDEPRPDLLAFFNHDDKEEDEEDEP